jgi:hypothetical protein
VVQQCAYMHSLAAAFVLVVLVGLRIVLTVWHTQLLRKTHCRRSMLTVILLCQLMQADACVVASWSCLPGIAADVLLLGALPSGLMARVHWWLNIGYTTRQTRSSKHNQATAIKWCASHACIHGHVQPCPKATSTHSDCIVHSA